MGQFLDRAAAVFVLGAGMGRAAGDGHRETAHALAGGDQLAAVAGRLGHQNVFRLLRLGLDHRAAGRAADLLLGDEQEGHRHARSGTQAAQVAVGVIRQIGTRLHVVDAGAVEAIALAADLVAVVLGADGMDRVHMAEYQDARRVLGPVRGAHDQMVAEAVLALDAVDRAAGAFPLVLDLVGQFVQARRIVGRRLHLHPLEDALDDFFLIDGGFVVAGSGGAHDGSGSEINGSDHICRTDDAKAMRKRPVRRRNATGRPEGRPANSYDPKGIRGSSARSRRWTRHRRPAPPRRAGSRCRPRRPSHSAGSARRGRARSGRVPGPLPW